ncbi:IucA/IucC family C-terminal-domain containing protein [Aeribacillus composti]|jgi:ferric iron reductase protein FhuF|uniref:IucA/IucC family C-terminal-domain containing protein n=1 Tax=Aeribacillus composti TaxID=1868734 RepID=A0ABY9WCQ1_9BACI|nr:IucA/IucC family C-terminal-domain containing protein [Aeribacillus composti]WNF33896.1 IucA/IucC family C-terminal-domain containing protein [Aeribacillus composti]
MGKLTFDEIKVLSKFRYSEAKRATDSSIDMEELLKPEKLQLFLKNIQPKFNAPLYVAGSMFIKRYAFLAALALYTMTMFDKALKVDIKNLVLITDDEDPLWLPGFYFKSNEVTIAPQERKKWRDEMLTLLFKENITRLLQVVSTEAKISKWILWENVAIYIFWMYETLLNEKQHEDKHEKIKEDFIYCVKEAKGELFGDFNRNPLKKFFGPKTYSDQYDDYIRKRKTCCLFYLTDDDGKKCRTCPNVSECTIKK